MTARRNLQPLTFNPQPSTKVLIRLKTCACCKEVMAADQVTTVAMLDSKRVEICDACVSDYQREVGLLLEDEDDVAEEELIVEG